VLNKPKKKKKNEGPKYKKSPKAHFLKSGYNRLLAV
jgi:hypothetical protein